MLDLLNISKTFNPGTVNEKKALDGVSLHLDKGEFVTIVGSNGAGKSTLFHAIAGAFYVDEGSIDLDGEDITFQPEYRRSRELGRLFQDPMKGTAPHMTIEENLSLAYLRAGKPRNAYFSRITKKDKEFFRQQLSLLGMGLEDRMRQPVGLLSGVAAALFSSLLGYMGFFDPEWRFIPMVGASGSIYGIMAAVSYTHLDVYQRQPGNCSRNVRVKYSVVIWYWAS